MLANELGPLINLGPLTYEEAQELLELLNGNHEARDKVHLWFDRLNQQINEQMPTEKCIHCRQMSFKNTSWYIDPLLFNIVCCSPTCGRAFRNLLINQGRDVPPGLNLRLIEYFGKS